MKKDLKIIFFSCILGITLAGVFFFNIKEKASAKNKPVLYAFQVGVFKNKENATNFHKRYSFARVLFDEEYYRVFIGVTKNNKEYLSKWFSDKGYSYYIKEIEASEKIHVEIEKYDELLIKTDEDNKEMLIKNMLESLPNEL